jgi:MMP alpha-(1->4)-mannosyltransferase
MTTADSTPKLRILRIADVSRDAAGGIREYMVSSGEALERRGHSVAYWFSDDLRVRAVPGKLRRLVIPWLIAAKVLGSRRVRRGFDIVEIHEPLAFGYGLLRAALRFGDLPPCVALSHGLEARGWQAQRERWRVRGERAPLGSRISVPLTRLAPARIGLRYASAILVPSSADREYLINARHHDPSRVVFVPTGTTTDLLSLSPTPTQSVGLIFVGSWIDRKGTPELVAAWQELAARHPGLRLTVVGTGVARERVLADFSDTARSGVEVRARVDREQLAELLASHQIFVLPSWFEGMPLSMLEAAAAGLPCVVCNVCGCIDFIGDAHSNYESGVLVPPHDAAALATALERLIVDPALRTRLGAGARRRAREFTWAHTAERTEAGYRRASATSAGSPRRRRAHV